MNNFWQDFRFALRSFLRTPGFTAVAVLTLALGIGANTALFSIVNGVLLNPLPYPEPEQLVTLHESKPNFPTGSISYPNFRDWQRDNQTFSAIAVARRYSFSLTGVGDAEQVPAQFVSSDFFRLLGVNPVIGRTFSAGEDEIGAAPLAVVSAGFWKRKFGASPEVLGKSITLYGKPYTIVGVIPESFNLLRVADVYVPIGQWDNPLLRDRGAGLGIRGIGRLKTGITIQQARADMERVTRNLALAYPDANKGIGASLIPLKEDMIGDIRPFLLVLLAAVGFVLLIACVNVANLLLARSTARTREFAIRASLGAGPARLVGQLLTESSLLALTGGGLGLLLASWSTRAALGLLPSALPRADEIRLDPRVLLFTLGISLLAGILFGLAPAFRTSKPQVYEALKEGRSESSRVSHRAQGTFVVAEMALALLLLTGAGLMIRTLTELWRVNPGFQPENVLTFGLSLPPSMMQASPDAIRAALRDVHEKLETAPGVQAVSLTWNGALPMAGDDEVLFWLAGQPKPQNQNDMNWALNYVVEPGYLDVMRIALLRGRFFNAQDDERAPRVAVVDDVFARQFFSSEDPIRKRIHLNIEGDPQVEIVGVVGHVKQWGLDSDDRHDLRAQLYRPYMQLPDMQFPDRVVLRTSGADRAPFESIRRVLQSSNHEIVVYGAQTMNEIISASLAARRFSMTVLSIFAALALLLASVGIYGVVSYLVGRRTHEIGIRLALGAERRDVLRLVLGEGGRMALVGVAIGLAAAFGLTRLLAKYSLLFGVSARDPITFLSVAILLLAVALLACYLPARRASRVDPVIALRYE